MTSKRSSEKRMNDKATKCAMACAASERKLRTANNTTALSSIVITVAILLIAFSFVIFAAPITERPFLLDVNSPVVGWSALVILIVAALLGAAYMIAKVFAISSWEAWVKEESTNLLFTVFLFIMFMAMSGVVESVATSLASDILASSVNTGAGGSAIGYWTYNSGTGRWAVIGSTTTPTCEYPCQFYIARGFLGSTYEKYGAALKGIAQAQAVSMLYETLGMGTTLDFQLPFGRIDLAISPALYAGRSIFNNVLSAVVDEYLKLTTNLKIQEIALAYMAGLSSTFFVVGLVTRILWITRKFGGLLVAIGVGLYVILPLVYVLAWYTVDKSTSTLTPGAIAGKDMIKDDVSSMLIPGSFGEDERADVSPFFTVYDGAGRETQIGILDALGRAYIPSIVIPMLAMFVTIGFIRHFSPMIGGDNEIAGITRII